MSAPSDRLLGDDAAQRFELEALALLSAVPLLMPVVERLALAVVALTRDRQARLELATICREEPMC